jgi:DNA-binding transcriptional regulator WhiA
MIQVKDNLHLVKKLIKEGKSLKEISTMLGLHSSSVGRALNKLGVKYNRVAKQINNKQEDFFSVINTELKAYLLGFFIADGSVEKSRIKVGVAEQDSEVVYLFKDTLAPEVSITITDNQRGVKKRQRQFIFKLTSRKLIQDLEKLGIVSRKTFKPIHIPPNLSEDLTWHFIRGYFDGDGNLSIDNRSKFYIRITFCNGDPTILKDILHFIGHGTLKALPTKDGSSFYHILYIDNTQKVLNILHRMYCNANYKLSRKYNKFLYVNTELSSRYKSLEPA